MRGGGGGWNIAGKGPMMGGLDSGGDGCDSAGV